MKVEPPPDDFLIKLQRQLYHFQKVLASGDVTLSVPMENEEITQIAKALRESTVEEPIERGVSALLAFHGHNEPEPIEEIVEEVVDEGILTIFTPLKLPANFPPLLVKDTANFSKSLLSTVSTRDYLMSIERNAGAKDRFSGTVANEIIKDFKASTQYPPTDLNLSTSEQLTAVTNDLVSKIIEARKKAEENSEVD